MYAMDKQHHTKANKCADCGNKFKAGYLITYTLELHGEVGFQFLRVCFNCGVMRRLAE